MQIFIVLALIVPAFARPQQPQSGAQTTPVSIVSQTEVVGADGSFNFSYDTSNGIHVEQGGYVKKGAENRALDPNNPDDSNGDIQVIQGAYSYTAPDGQQISLRYLADENGFQPEGEHLPRAPTGQGVEQQYQLGQQQQHQLGQQQHQLGQPQQQQGQQRQQQQQIPQQQQLNQGQQQQPNINPATSQNF